VFARPIADRLARFARKATVLIIQGRVTVSFCATLIALGGCATKAQQEVSRIEGIAAASAPVINACWARAVASPPHQALRGKMGDDSDALTLAMKTNAEKATSAEAAQMVSLQRDYLAPCRKIALESAGKVHPTIVAILAESYAKAEANAADLVAYKIGWGEFVTENQAIVNQRRGELLLAGESIQRSLSKSP
jgi:hypothetical protein